MERTCYDCKCRVVNVYKGDRCGKGDFPLMDDRFKYEYELLKLRSGRPRYCPLDREEGKK